ncbi:hypothetical protein CFC21_001028 [Triticum aestivum]|uniref:Uncharacterized protein n=2 Tax=Triticum TaxID=4564 RepID=A0A9R0Q2X6_TRITD|nr:hypothetical protein CFC21_001028 [Triticum aestivum]VAH02353.1 unnamed protein product [Triticum turgidum subsp. durum]
MTLVQVEPPLPQGFLSLYGLPEKEGTSRGTLPALPLEHLAGLPPEEQDLVNRRSRWFSSSSFVEAGCKFQSPQLFTVSQIADAASFDPGCLQQVAVHAVSLVVASCRLARPSSQFLLPSAALLQPPLLVAPPSAQSPSL